MDKLKGLIIAACASNSGKTVTSLSLICALESLGIPVIAAKSGPDYIDSSWLAWASGRPCVNLDLCMACPGGLEILRQRMSSELKGGGIFILEAAMGFYDGDRQGRYSTAELSVRMKVPVILLLNARGMGHSLAAMAQGYLNYKAEWMKSLGFPRFLGVICTHTGGESHEQLCREILTPILERKGLKYFGSLPAKDAPVINSRHLGLKGPREIILDKGELSDFFKKAIPPEKILNCIDYIPNSINLECKRNKRPRFFFSPLKRRGKPHVTIAIARDSAFSFCYADLPAMLKEAGARIVFFSPLADHILPHCDCIFLPGGYPELYARRLASNLSMLAEIREAAGAGKPIYGECGGYIYLGQSLKLANGQIYDMCKLLSPHFECCKRLNALGYRVLESESINLISSSKILLHGHEFHYSRSISCAPAPTCKPLWKYRNSKGSVVYDGYINGRVMGAWSHLYPEGSRPFWRFFLSLCHTG